ncbi:MAG TPA: glycosyltransferase family 4 protein [Candidatus Binatia bacterium]|nr:glycosyltransferase family 4 protein [Candidatus Binatia bacterium]
MSSEPLRICLLTYRGNPRSGGQGIYIRLLSRALVELGHRVDVWSGPPYPELLPGVGFVEVPSLDLWNEAAFFRFPTLRELADPINVSEWTRTVTGGFPEPLTFCRRVARDFARGASARYDVVHDNQSLGPGLLDIQKRMPVVATIHHPVTVDRRIAIRAARGFKKRAGLIRWYTFLGSQLRVSRRLDRIVTISEASTRDLAREYRLPHERMRMVGNGIDLSVFRRLPGVARRDDLILTTLSNDSPLKGFAFLLEAYKTLRARRPSLELRVIGVPHKRSPSVEAVRRHGLDGIVRFTGRVDAEDIARHYAEATVAVVPSLYEGFGFPAGEAMACGVPVVSTRAGALPEVVGPEGEAGVLVEPGSGPALARAVDELLGAPERRRAMGEAGRARVEALFTWQRAAERTVDVYREAIAERASGPGVARARRENAGRRPAVVRPIAADGVAARVSAGAEAGC